MIKFVKKYKSMIFEEKTVFSTKFSIIFNFVLAIAKFILAIVFKNVFFVATGVLNIFFMLSKYECYSGIKYPNKSSFFYRNMMTGIFLMCAGIQYMIYMGRMLYSDIDLMKYDMFLGISIACVSFIELAIAIKGCFNSFGKGHYYRNIKTINLCSAFTAIVLTEVAIMSFASQTDSRFIDGIFGISVGGLIVLIAIFIFIAPKVSIYDREHNIYKSINNTTHSNGDLIIKLTNSKLYGNFYYKAIKNNDIVDGHIIKGKSPIRKWNIFIKILVIILSEILIFPYAIGAIIFYYKNATIIKKLDKKMYKEGYIKIVECED